MTTTTETEKTRRRPYDAQRYAKRKAAKCKRAFEQTIAAGPEAVATPRPRELPDEFRVVLAAAFPKPKRGALAYRLMYDPSVTANRNGQSDGKQAEASILASAEEDALHQASFFVARCDAAGHAVPGVEFCNDGRTATSEVLPEFAKGDRGERYVVTAFDPVLGLRFTYGWTERPGKLLVEIMGHKRFWGARVKDREPSPTERLQAHLARLNKEAKT
jgi:hypothetical protein